MLNFVSGYIEHFTYAGLFIVLMLCGLGLPLPEDLALLTGGYLAHRGLIQYPFALGISLLGVITGDNSLFFIGRHAGSRILRYFGIGRRGENSNIARIRNFFERHGNRAIFYARFLAGLRALVYLSAGSFGIAPARFFLYDLLGAVISVPIVVSVGYLFGAHLEKIVKYLGGLEHLLLIVGGLCLLVYATRLLVQRANEA